MVVIVLEKCPLALRGDLTKWLQEVSPGVYIGQVSARVRDGLWDRVRECSASGRATMVYSARNEQHLDFRVHNAAWEPIDFDGMKLMLRPSPARIKALGERRLGRSPVVRHRVRRGAGVKVVRDTGEPCEYVVLDLETTGLDPEHDEIVEIGAIKYIGGAEAGRFHALVKTSRGVPPGVTGLTGIGDDEMIDARELRDAVGELLFFLGTMPLVLHNASFDMQFLDVALERFGYDELGNELIDTLSLARKKVPSAPSHRLEDLAARLGIDYGSGHRAVPDCLATRELFVRLLGM